jgi:hypothetical protein
MRRKLAREANEGGWAGAGAGQMAEANEGGWAGAGQMAEAHELIHACAWVMRRTQPPPPPPPPPPAAAAAS